MAQILLIDITNQVVSDYIASDNQEVLTAIGNGASALDMYKLPNGDYLVYDMGGFFRTPVGGFVHKDMKWLLLCNACVIGYDPVNGTVNDCVTDAVSLLQDITFLNSNEVSNN